MNTDQKISFKYAITVIFLVFVAYNAGNIIASLFAENLLAFGGGFLSSFANVVSIILVALVAFFMARLLNEYTNNLIGNNFIKNVLIAFVGFVLLFVFIWGWETYTQDNSGNALLKTLNFGESINNDFWLIVGVVLTGPLLEELVFRWLIYTTLRNALVQFLSTKVAIGMAAVISSALFVSIHGAPEQVSQALPLFVMGVVFALIYQISHSLVAVFIAHSLNNAVALYLGLIDIDITLSAGWLNIWLFAVIALGLMLIVLLHYVMKIKTGK